MKLVSHYFKNPRASKFAHGQFMFILAVLILPMLAWSQPREPVTYSAKSMSHSSGVVMEADYATIYGDGSRKTYLYQDLSALPFRKFQLYIEAAADTAARRWPELGIAFQDTNSVLKQITLHSTKFQEYDLGLFEAPGRQALYLIFMNDYYDAATRQDVNLKIRQARLVPAELDTTIVRGTSLTLRWQPNGEADLAGYRIYHGVVSGKYLNERIEVNKDSTTHVFPVAIGCDYFYAISAIDTAGNESPRSAEVMARVRPLPIVATPDLNHDQKCDAKDIQVFQKAFGLTCKHTRFNAEADFNGDCRVDADDQTLFLQKYKTCAK